MEQRYRASGGFEGWDKTEVKEGTHYWGVPSVVLKVTGGRCHVSYELVLL